MNSGKVLLGILAGVAAGALAGILFAPDKGTRTRKKILSKGQDYADELREQFDVFLDSIAEKVEGIEHEAEGLVVKGKTKYNEAKKEIINSLDNH